MVSREQGVITIAVVALVVLSAVLSPAALIGDSGPEDNITTIEGERYEYDDASGPSTDGLNNLNALPSSYTDQGENAPDPPEQVRASAGSQTMNVETAVVDGEPAIVLEDDRTHDGRWVSIDTAWFEQHLGEVPSAAYIDHESGGEYASAINVRGDSAAFYVRSFSTNTVTFDGEISLSGSEAGDGTQYEYELNSTDGVDDPSINLTGVNNTAWNNVTATGVSASNERDITIGGTTQPEGPANGNPELEVTAKSERGEYNPVSAEGDGGADTGVYILGDDGSDNKINSEIQINPNNSGELQELTIDAAQAYGSEYDAQVDIYIYQGEVNTAYGEGQKVRSGWNPTWTTGEQSVSVDPYTLSKDTNYTVEFVTTNTDADGLSDRILLASDDSSSEAWASSSGSTENEYGDLTATIGTNVSGLDVDLDGETKSLGDFQKGETKTVELTPTTGEKTLNFSASSNGEIDYSLKIREKTETRDPVVELNGETVGVDGTLADGETASLSQNASALQEGTNTVNISTNSPSSGPASLVGFEYTHSAEATVNATVSETTWSQETNVSRTWPSARNNATAEIPMNDRVVDVRTVELRVNGTTWEPVAESDYVLNGTDLTVELGDVAAGSTTEVRATGSKVRVTDGAITVLDPTTGSETLDTRIQVDDAGPDFALSVDETVFGDRVHYADNATWGATGGETTITAEGGQTLTLPNATAGAEASVRTWPIEVAPTTGQVTVPELAGEREEPGIAVRGDGNSEVDYTYVNAEDATPYVLYSQTNEIVRDEGLASSPITLTDDNSDETLVFLVDDGSASGSGSGSTSSVGAGAAGPMVDAGGSVLGQLQGIVPSGQTVVVVLGLLGGLFVVGRQTGVITEDRQEAATSAATSAAGTAGSLVERALDNEIVVGALILGAGGVALGTGLLPEQARLIVGLGAAPVAVYLGLQQFGEFDFRVWLGSTLVIALLGMNVLAPSFFETIAQEAGILLAIGGLYLGYRLINAFRAEAETPDEETNVTFEVDDDGGN